MSDADGPPDYLELPVGRFLDLVAAGNSAPGGGSAAAVSVALAARLASDGNPSLEGDAVCAVLLADAGVRAAVTLVEINLSGEPSEDGRLERARELVGTAASARQSAEGEV